MDTGITLAQLAKDELQSKISKLAEYNQQLEQYNTQMENSQTGTEE